MTDPDGTGTRARVRESLGRRDLLKGSAGAVVGALVARGTDARAGALEDGATRAGRAGESASPFPPLFEKSAWDARGLWEASWIGCADAGAPPAVHAYRLRFDWPASGPLRVRVSADERYELFLDGRRVRRGPERGTLEHWFYDTLDLALDAGPHVLVARVASLGPHAPLAQFQVRPAFLLAAEGQEAKRLDTGTAPWEAMRLPGYAIEPPVYVWGLSAPVTVDGAALAWGFERGEAEGWRPAVAHERASSALLAYGIAPRRRLQAGTLPPMIDQPWARGRVRHVSAAPSLDTLAVPVRAAEHIASEAAQWQDALAGRAALVVPAGTRRRAIVDLEDYVCAYPSLVVSGGRGARVRLQFAEALRVKPEKWSFDKGDRDAIEGKFFLGMGDVLLPAGGARQRLEPLWFGSGRYLEIAVETQGEALAIERVALDETRYPLELESRFDCSDGELASLLPLLVRGMQACAHETWFDCPHFEQMQYVGDLRLEALVQYAMTRDDRLTRKGLYLVDASRHASGLTESRYPVREPQFIPWFSLLWIGAVHDHARWRDDPAFTRALLPGVRAVLESFLAQRGHEGAVRTPEGWNDTERTSEQQTSGLTNWLLAWTLRLAAELEDGFGDAELAARDRRLFAAIAAAADRVFWSEARGLYTDAPGGEATSDLVQSLALLSGGCPPARRARLARALFAGQAARRANVHTLHYLFECARLERRPDVLFERLETWSRMRKDGLRTPAENSDPTRSDCHAWGSHPLHHCFATLLGVQPAGWGFRRVEIAPLLGRVERASGRLVHPAGGEVVVEVERRGAAQRGRVTLPPGVSGTLRLESGARPLGPGETVF
jgi:hypothetical protein